MRNKILILVIAILALVAGILLVKPRTGLLSKVNSPNATQPAASPEANHSHASSADRVPAYLTAGQVDKLDPTLPAAQFTGKVREAYKVAKEIPGTLAQLPCYCHCDEAFGHKSLQSCFVDDHASHCAVCVDEALLAYKLQKEEKLSPERVREIIIEKFQAGY